MAFVLTVDDPRWTEQLSAAAARLPGLVPVVKGNGYGFGSGLLAERCARLGADTVAVGVAAEVATVRRHFAGDVLVMAPLTAAEATARPVVGPEPDGDPRMLRTVAHADVLALLAVHPLPPRIVLELDSPMHRHGIGWEQLPELAPVLRRLPIEGVAMHLPAGARGLPAARAALDALRRAGIEPGTLWVSHLAGAELAELAAAAAPVRVRPRVGTALWLGDRSAFSTTGTVLDTHPVPRGRVGYRQRRVARGTLIVVSGGTAHGVGVHTAAGAGGWRARVRGALAGAAHGAGMAPSPFRWAGRRLRFADVPHMQVSMVLVPAGVEPPAVGDRLPCDVRMTVSTFDTVTVAGGYPSE